VDFQDRLAQNGSFWGQNRGRGGALLTLNEFVLILGVVTYVPLLAKINQEMQP